MSESPEKDPKQPKQDKAPKQPKGEKPSKGQKQPKGGEGGQMKGEKAPARPSEPAPPPRLKLRFRSEVLPKIRQEFSVANVMALPRLDKVILNVGLGKQLEGSKLNVKAKEQVLKDLTVITGQRPVMCKAKKSVANFKLREGYEVGAMVTLRGDRMWEFIDRLISLSIPRIKDFRGVSAKSFDASGNYSFGIVEQGIFPEIDMAAAEFTHGMHITFVFRNSDPKKSLALLKELGMPFQRPEDLQNQRRKSA